MQTSKVSQPVASATSPSSCFAYLSKVEIALRLETLNRAPEVVQLLSEDLDPLGVGIVARRGSSTNTLCTRKRVMSLRPA